MESSRAGQDPRSLDQLTLVYAMVDHIQRARRVEHVYEEAAQGLREVLSVECAAVLTQSGPEGMRLRARAGLSPAVASSLEGYAPWPVTQREARPLMVGDLSAERLGQPVYEALRSEGLSTVAWVPLLHRGRLIGEILLGRATSSPLTEPELRLAEVIAGHVAFSIWRTRSDEDQAELLRRFEAERSVLDSVVKQMPAGVLLADVPSGRIITSNPQIRSIWRKMLRHADRISDYGMWGGLDGEGQPLDPRAWPLARSVEHGETVRGEEIRIERGDGTRGIVRMSSSPVVDSRGRPLAAVATVFDVTEEWERERKKAFLENATQVLNGSLEIEETLASVAAVVLGDHADWCLVHRRTPDALTVACAEHGDGARAERMSRFVGAVVPHGSGHPLARATDAADVRLLEGDDALAVVAGDDPELLSAAREQGCHAALVLPLVSRDQVLGVVTLVRGRDRYLESELELMREFARRASLAVDNALLYERARSADRAKSSFLAVMSHEFRTPLSAILGYADILTARVHGDLNDVQAKHVERVKASVRHLSHLVDEILSFASMEAGRERVNPSRTDLRALVSDAAGILEPVAEASGLDLTLDLPEEDLVLRTDASKVRQIVINLVSNAVKYTPDGKVTVELARDGERVLCRVSDTGLGIAPEHVERVFEPFWQVDQSDGRRITGTGLGLTVARQLARLLGGDLVLESEVGAGSRFTLVLPPVPAVKAGAAEASTGVAAGSSD